MFLKYLLLHLFLSGVHVLGAKCTPIVDCLYSRKQGQKNPFLPTSLTELQKLLELVLYQPKRFFLTKHLLKAILKVQMKYYPNFEKGRWIYVKLFNALFVSYEEMT